MKISKLKNLLEELYRSFLCDVREVNEIDKQTQSHDYVHPTMLTIYESIPENEKKKPIKSKPKQVNDNYFDKSLPGNRQNDNKGNECTNVSQENVKSARYIDHGDELNRKNELFISFVFFVLNKRTRVKLSKYFFIILSMYFQLLLVSGFNLLVVVPIFIRRKR